MPNLQQRYELWQNSFKNLKTEEDVDLKYYANKHSMTGGSIINVLRYCSLSALRRGSQKISNEDIKEGIKKELRKEGKTI